MGENANQPFQFAFSASLKVDSQGSRVASAGGLILVRELDERLAFSELIEQDLTDSRAKRTQLPLADLLRHSVNSRLAGYKDVNDAERLSQDPTLRLIGSGNIWERCAALTSRPQSFETEVPAQEENLAGLGAIDRDLIARAESLGPPPGGWCWTWTGPRSRSTPNKSTAPTTAISSLPATTRCCCSIETVTVWQPSCGRAMCIGPKVGKLVARTCRKGPRLSWPKTDKTQTRGTGLMRYLLAFVDGRLQGYGGLPAHVGYRAQERAELPAGWAASGCSTVVVEKKMRMPRFRSETLF